MRLAGLPHLCAPQVDPLPGRHALPWPPALQITAPRRQRWRQQPCGPPQQAAEAQLLHQQAFRLEAPLMLTLRLSCWTLSSGHWASSPRPFPPFWERDPSCHGPEALGTQGAEALLPASRLFPPPSPTAPPEAPGARLSNGLQNAQTERGSGGWSSCPIRGSHRPAG